MLDGAAEAQAVGGAWGVVVGLDRDGVPAEAAFNEALDDGPQAADDGLLFKVTGAAPAVATRMRHAATRRA